MSIPKVFVDGRLLTWSDTLFSPPYRKPKGGAKPISWRAFKFNPGAAAKARAQIDRTVRKFPEVMVKITSTKGAGRGMKNIRNHLDYISRNGKLELENELGDTIKGKAELEDLKTLWQYSSGKTIAEEENPKKHFRDTLNIVFSMQPGTPPEKVKDAVRELLHDEFQGREYLFTLHTDTLHPHVHVCVKTTKTPTLKRLNPNRADLQRWREGFAEKLRDNGIEANATARRTRGQPKLPVRLNAFHRAKKQNQSLEPRSNSATTFARQELQAWKHITEALNVSEDAGDRKLAKETLGFWKDTPLALLKKSQKIEPPMTERPTHEQQWRLAATRLHQSDHSPTANQSPQKIIQARTSLYELPRSNLASEPRQTTEMLLYQDAPDYMGWRLAAHNRLRRADIRATSAQRGGGDITSNTPVLPSTESTSVPTATKPRRPK